MGFGQNTSTAGGGIMDLSATPQNDAFMDSFSDDLILLV